MALQNVKDHITTTINADGASNKVLTVPNAITFLRIILVPVAAYLILAGYDIAAIITIVISCASDFLDGFLARKFNSVTKVGRVLDPLADRLLIFVVLLLLAFRIIIPVWCVLAVLLRELILLFQYGQLVLHGRKPIPVKFIGKVGSAGLMIAMPLMFFARSPEIINKLTDPGRFDRCTSSNFEDFSCAGSLPEILAAIGFGLLAASIMVYWYAGILYCNDAAKILVKEPSKRAIIISAVITAVVAIGLTALILIITPGGLVLFS